MHKLLNLNSQKYVCSKWTYWRSVIDYRVASLSIRYQTAKGIIPESLKCLKNIYKTTKHFNRPSFQIICIVLN